MADTPLVEAIRPKIQMLVYVSQECQKAWGDDPAFAETAKKLRIVERELDTIIASPGHRAAMRAGPANQTGQVRGEYGETSNG